MRPRQSPVQAVESQYGRMARTVALHKCLCAAMDDIKASSSAWGCEDAIGRVASNCT
jgi:hypothetical protein